MVSRFAILASASIALLTAVGLSACTSSSVPAQKSVDDRDGASTASSIAGSWTSDESADLKLTVNENSELSFLGGGCAANGNWTEENGEFKVTIETIGDVGGAPQCYSLDLSRLNSLKLIGPESLAVDDVDGNSERFAREK